VAWADCSMATISRDETTYESAYPNSDFGWEDIASSFFIAPLSRGIVKRSRTLTVWERFVAFVGPYRFEQTNVIE
jgi:hypothetical protein